MKQTKPDDARYASHLALKPFGGDAHARIRRSSVALVGLGGLGCAAAQYLVSSGLGRLSLYDFDRVEESNLARQVLYHAGDLGQPKVVAAAAALERLNPDTELSVRGIRVDTREADRVFRDHDLVIDASDNYGTRLAINRAALSAVKPWLMGSCIRFEGQWFFFSGQDRAPCYRCIYGQAPDTLEDCPGAGIFAPVAGLVGTALAHQALLFLAGMGLPRRLELFDGLEWTWRSVGVSCQPECKDCGERAPD